MADLKTLREQMANIATEARAKLSEVTDATDETRAADVEREFDAMMADHDKLSARADRMEKVEKALRAGEAVDFDGPLRQSTKASRWIIVQHLLK
jgi:hypothetical protein